ncbi:permease [Candidatus Formimonas warabiya]|uniref:Permease n=1 Tax=Formimonas warabiya TaxID=1761012 RepID=A0A3G1KMN3_FORW1|nr:permease [Candidatus Formimonas warabiya]ATW23723.1 hypothetical protein DCMF_01965 [Candidatus Formimonas warabiya]
MLVPLLIFSFTLIIINKKKGRHVNGLKDGGKQLINVLPLIAAALLLAGMIEAVIPKEFVQQWLAHEAGIKGIILGSFGGMCLAMGPYAAFPIMASIYKAGAGLSTMVSVFAGWAFMGVLDFTYEGSIFGIRFAATKLALGLPFCFLTGGAAYLLESVLLKLN